MIDTSVTRPREANFPIVLEREDRVHQPGQIDIYQGEYVQATDPEGDHIVLGSAVCPSPALELGPTMAPDGRVAFFSDREGDWKVYAGKPGQEKPSVLLDRDDVVDVRFSPDGEQMAFITAKDGWDMGLWLARPDGSEARPVPLGKLEPWEAQYSPDGRSLLFTSFDFNPETDGLYQLDLNSLKTKQLAQGDLWTPCLSPDGKSAAYVEFGSEANTVLRLDLETGQKRALVEECPGLASSLCFSPDASRLILTTMEYERNGLYVIPAQKGGLVELTGRGEVAQVEVCPPRQQPATAVV